MPLPESLALPSFAIVPSSAKYPGCPSVPRDPCRLLLVMVLSNVHVYPSVLPLGGQVTLVRQVPSKRSVAKRTPGKRTNEQTRKRRTALCIAVSPSSRDCSLARARWPRNEAGWGDAGSADEGPEPPALYLLKGVDGFEDLVRNRFGQRRVGKRGSLGFS